MEDDIEEDDAANAVEVEHSSQVVSAPQGSLPEWLQPEGGTAPPEISSGWSEADPDSTDTDSEPELVERENKLGRSRSSAGDEDEDSSYHFVEEGTPVSVEPLQVS